MRLETRFVQVPNQPKYINSLNELARVFGWTVHIIQVIDRKHSFVSGSHGISTDYGVFMFSNVVTEEANYASITYQRDLDMPEYSKLKALEDQYNECDAFSYLSNEENNEFLTIQKEFDGLRKASRVLSVFFLILALILLFFAVKMQTLLPFFVCIAACVGFWLFSKRYKSYRNSKRYCELVSLDNKRRMEHKKYFVDQARALY